MPKCSKKKFVKHLKFSSKSLFRNNLFSEQFHKCSGEIFKIVLKNGLVCSETINLFRKHPDCSEILRCFQKCFETFWLVLVDCPVLRMFRNIHFVPKHFTNLFEGTFHNCSSQIFKIVLKTFRFVSKHLNYSKILKFISKTFQKCYGTLKTFS